ncbi:permease [Evansella sp. AB-P1]|uniref:permease n=1 Tax=Evansella sp. AB-P1 TaxID=3037653 RepID=UPI00241F1777|nr:permease [Evansella sp. AB-P1]MDG5786206.1 permease [Evansella sp. AB-P1]
MERYIFFIGGVFFLLLTGFIFILAFFVEENPNQHLYLLGMGIMGVCLGYLSPQFRQNDERSKLIKQKGIGISFIALFAYFIFFMVSLELQLFYLTAQELLSILSALMISTVFISFVIYSKIY